MTTVTYAHRYKRPPKKRKSVALTGSASMRKRGSAMTGQDDLSDLAPEVQAWAEEVLKRLQPLSPEARRRVRQDLKVFVEERLDAQHDD